jgi:hypothetical protein
MIMEDYMKVTKILSLFIILSVIFDFFILQNVFADGPNFGTIKEKGVTVDYDYNMDHSDLQFEIYIDGTNYYFFIDFFESGDCEYSIVIANIKTNNDATYNNAIFVPKNGEKIDDIIDELNNYLIAYFISNGIERRNANSIANIVIREIYIKFN